MQRGLFAVGKQRITTPNHYLNNEGKARHKEVLSWVPRLHRLVLWQRRAAQALHTVFIVQHRQCFRDGDACQLVPFLLHQAQERTMHQLLDP